MTLPDVAAVVGLSPRQVGDAVTAGILEPAERGSKGRGRVSKFGVVEVVGLACLVGLHRGPNVPVWFVTEWMARHRRTWTLSAVEHLLGFRDDPMSEEAVAKALFPKPPEEWQLDPKTGKRAKPALHPEDMKIVKDIRLNLARLRVVVLANLGVEVRDRTGYPIELGRSAGGKGLGGVLNRKRKKS